jgi:hypothetical protein
MAKREPPTLADYLTIALCPALIMALIGSLVFFLLEVLYVGKYEARLQWILTCFVFAAVLIARISMMAGISERAPLYGIVLGVAVWFALTKFVEFPEGAPLASFSWAIHIGMILLIWWCAHKLTWDCTFIDETENASGVGLLEAARLDSNAADPSPGANQSDGGAGEESGSWRQRYRRYRQQQRARPHAPGVWILYFSFAALPLFGLGQAALPASAATSRLYAFWMMVVYVASALGLLLCTSFLGLRRYLRQRKLKMPLAMTSVWLGMGAALIVILLGLAALLPRPYAEYALVSIGKYGSKEREASQFSPGGSEPGKGEGQPGSAGSKEGQGNASGKSDDTGGNNPSGTKSGSSRDGREGGDQGGKSNQDKGKQPGQGKDAASKSAQQSDSAKSSTQNRDARESNRSGESSSKDESKAESDRDGSSSSSEFQLPSVAQPLTQLAQWLKWIVFALIALVAGFFVIRALLRVLANFSGWAKGLSEALEKLWASLFGWLSIAPKPDTPADEEDAKPAPRPFSSYANPFHSGGGQSPEELVRYSFEALVAWAYEQGIERTDDDTAFEFAERIGLDVPDLGKDARRLASLYARAAYGRSRLQPAAADVVRQFWERLDSVGAAKPTG